MQQITYHFEGIPTYFTCKAEDFDKQVLLMRRKLSLSYNHDVIIVNENKEKENDTTINSSPADISNVSTDNSDNQEIPALSVGAKKVKQKGK